MRQPVNNNNKKKYRKKEEFCRRFFLVDFGIKNFCTSANEYVICVVGVCCSLSSGSLCCISPSESKRPQSDSATLRIDQKGKGKNVQHIIFLFVLFFFLIVYAAQHSLNFPSLIMLSAYEILIRWRENIEQCTAKIDVEIIICIWCDQKYDCRMNMTQDGVDEKNKFLMGNQSVWWRLLFHFSSQTGQR